MPFGVFSKDTVYGASVFFFAVGEIVISFSSWSRIYPGACLISRIRNLPLLVGEYFRTTSLPVEYPYAFDRQNFPRFRSHTDFAYGADSYFLPAPSAVRLSFHS